MTTTIEQSAIDAFNEDGVVPLRQDRRRRGYTIRYTGDDAVYDLRPGLSKPLLCDALVPGGPMDCDQYPLLIGAANR